MSDYDGIKLCEKCGEYTTGRLCNSCRQQEMIDNDPMEGFDALPECPTCGSFNVMTDFDAIEYAEGYHYCRTCHEEWIDEARASDE